MRPRAFALFPRLRANNVRPYRMCALICRGRRPRRPGRGLRYRLWGARPLPTNRWKMTSNIQTVNRAHLRADMESAPTVARCGLPYGRRGRFYIGPSGASRTPPPTNGVEYWLPSRGAFQAAGCCLKKSQIIAKNIAFSPDSVYDSVRYYHRGVCPRVTACETTHNHLPYYIGPPAARWNGRRNQKGATHGIIARRN